MTRDERREKLREELTARLERVRGQMTDAEFDELVSSVERTAARFAEIDAGPFRAVTEPSDEKGTSSRTGDKG
jgi:hypothetical protein